MPLTLRDPGLKAVDGSYIYVLSHAADDVERAVLLDHLKEASELHVITTGDGMVRVNGLTADNRADFEKALCEALIAANLAHAEAEATAKGNEWAESRAQSDAADAEAVSRSFKGLPAELPND